MEGFSCFLCFSLKLNYLLMTKFDKSEKIEPSDFSFRNVRFQQFQSKTKEEAKFKDLKIQDVSK
jgi:hypothetical protein